MTNVTFPPHLRRFIDLPESCQVTGETVRQALGNLEAEFPGILDYLVHENGRLRQHVNLFLDGRLIDDRESLSDSLEGVNELVVMQALSGG